MSLDIYEYDQENSVYNKISANGLQTNPVQTTHNGTDGEIVEKKLFLRNDNENFYYTDITLTAVPPRKVRVGDINYPEAFIGFKIVEKDDQPTENEWLAIESGNEANFVVIGDSSTGDVSYKPFWIQVSIPVGTRVQTISDVSIHQDAEQNAVGT